MGRPKMSIREKQIAGMKRMLKSSRLSPAERDALKSTIRALGAEAEPDNMPSVAVEAEPSAAAASTPATDGTLSQAMPPADDGPSPLAGAAEPPPGTQVAAAAPEATPAPAEPAPMRPQIATDCGCNVCGRLGAPKKCPGCGELVGYTAEMLTPYVELVNMPLRRFPKLEHKGDGVFQVVEGETLAITKDEAAQLMGNVAAVMNHYQARPNPTVMLWTALVGSVLAIATPRAIAIYAYRQAGKQAAERAPLRAVPQTDKPAEAKAE